MSLTEKAVNAICNICESNSIFDHITRLGMSDEYYVMAMALEAQRKAAKPVPFDKAQGGLSAVPFDGAQDRLSSSKGKIEGKVTRKWFSRAGAYRRERKLR